MKHFRIILILLLFFCGCMGKAARSSVAPGQLDVFGVAMYSSVDYREIRGVPGVDEPCLRGFERSFDALDIAVGYGKDGTIRKITTRNPQTSMLGIHPGEPVASALEKIRGAGFSGSGSSYRFRNLDLVLTILANGTGRLFGMTLEAVDP